MTLRVSLTAGLFACLLGITLGLLSLTKNEVMPRIVRGYVDFIRGTPLLIQIFLVFFALPALGIRFDEIWAGTIALGLNGAGYVAEIVRGVVGSVERGQREAALAIGMVESQILVYILLPQSIRAMLPPLTNELITLLKSSSLLSVISVYELTRAGQAVISIYFAPFEIYALIAIYYYVIVKVLSTLSRWAERRLPAW
jgi:polar amino acid transport system permease protein